MADTGELLTKSNKLFEELKERYGGVECWDARILMPHVGYSKWQDFHNAIQKAMQACRTNGEVVEKQFLRTSVKTSPQGGRPPVNYKLTRRACYFVFQNGDPKVPGIAAAQAYFVQQTIRQENADQRAIDWERHYEQTQNGLAESRLNRVALNRDVTRPELGVIRTNKDRVFFNHNSAQTKRRMRIPQNRTISDFLPARILVARTIATHAALDNIEEKDLRGKHKIGDALNRTHKWARDSLVGAGIIPEDSRAETDIRQVRIRLGVSNGPRKAIAPGQLSLFEGA